MIRETCCLGIETFTLTVAVEEGLITTGNGGSSGGVKPAARTYVCVCVCVRVIVVNHSWICLFFDQTYKLCQPFLIDLFDARRWPLPAVVRP